jgi:tetratricopeptide (TPR) repeat protein
MADYKDRSYLSKIGQFIAITFIFLTSILVSCECGDDVPQEVSFPWLSNQYSEVSDSILREMALENDTLAAMTWTWRQIQQDSLRKAAQFISDYNISPETAPDDLNYITGLAFVKISSFEKAIPYFKAFENYHEFPKAAHYLALSYRKSEQYDQALELYNWMKGRKQYRDDNISDSILRCHADMGDTLAGIEIGRKFMELNKIGDAAEYFYRYVPLARGKVPPAWYFWAGKTYLDGNNFTRAAVYLENADADTTFAELSYLSGLAYYEIEAFDSAYSKFHQALELGDSSYSTIYYDIQFMALFDMTDSALYY